MTSLGAVGDVVLSSSSRAAADDVGVVHSSRRQCGWCRLPLEQTAPPGTIYHSQKCRQAAFRLRRRRQTDERNEHPMRMAYADPPYPGKARRYGMPEVDHRKLIDSLLRYDGWALSTSAEALRDVLPMCPPDVHVCPWVKPIAVTPATFGLHNRWEALIVRPGRELRPGKRDFLIATPARGGGTLVGRKPIAFCAFLFDALGLLPGDTLDDLFPGTGIVSRAWANLSSEYSRDERRLGTDATSE
jgi:hypothetical protein